MDKSDYIKIKDFCSWKDTIKRAQCHELGEALCNAYLNEEFLQVCVRRARREEKTGETPDPILSESIIERQKNEQKKTHVQPHLVIEDVGIKTTMRYHSCHTEQSEGSEGAGSGRGCGAPRGTGWRLERRLGNRGASSSRVEETHAHDPTLPRRNGRPERGRPAARTREPSPLGPGAASCDARLLRAQHWKRPE